MALPKFYLRSSGENAPIQIIFQVSRNLRMRTSTGLKINSNDWSEAKGLPKQNSPENKNLSTNLQKLIPYLQEQYTEDYTNGVSFSNDWLKNKIDKYFDRPDENAETKPDDNLFLVYLENYLDFRKLKNETKITTERKFYQLRKKFQQYEKKKKVKISISDIDSRFILNFKKFMIDDLGNMESTANEILRKLKTVLLNARNFDDKTINKSVNALKIKSSEAVKVFLSFKEIEKIKNAQIIGADLQHAKDWLIIGVNTGQRVSDLLRMTKEMIYTSTDSDGASFDLIGLTQEKTKTKVAIPINDEVQEVLDKYGGDFPPSFGKRGESNKTLFNRYIKTVCRLAGITNTVKGRIFNDETKRNEIGETEKYKLVSSHICRRSFATNYYGDNRFTTAELMSITGHKTETVFLNYIGKTAEDHALKTAKTFKKIAEEKKQKIS